MGLDLQVFGLISASFRELEFSTAVDRILLRPPADRSGRPDALHRPTGGDDSYVSGRPVYTGFDPVWPGIAVLTPVFGENPN